MLTKRCNKCGVEKPHDEYYKESVPPHRPRSLCKQCILHRQKRWGKANARWAYLKREYGVSKGQYNSMYEAQDGRCAICDTPEPQLSRNLNVDHDHATGQIRGLLCGSCNSVLGMAQDDPERLRKALAYLAEYA